MHAAIHPDILKRSISLEKPAPEVTNLLDKKRQADLLVAKKRSGGNDEERDQTNVQAAI